MGGVVSSPNRRKSRQRIYSCLADLEIVTIGGNLPLLFSKGLHIRPYPFNKKKETKRRSNQEIGGTTCGSLTTPMFIPE